MSQPINPLFKLASEYRQDVKDKTLQDFVVPRKNKKSGEITWERDPKHASHSALRTLKAINSQLDKEALKKLAKENPELLKNVRYLAKGVNAGFMQKYVKSKSNFLDGLRVLIGKKSERELIEEQLDKINKRIDEALGHSPKKIEQEGTTLEHTTNLNKKMASVQNKYSELMSQYNKASFSKKMKIKDEIIENVRQDFNKIVEDYKNEIPKLNAHELRQAKRELDFIRKNFQKMTPQGDRLFYGMSLILGFRLPDEIRAKYAEFYKAYKHEVDQKKGAKIIDKSLGAMKDTGKDAVYIVKSVAQDAFNWVSEALSSNKETPSIREKQVPAVEKKQGPVAEFRDKAQQLRKQQEKQNVKKK